MITHNPLKRIKRIGLIAAGLISCTTSLHAQLLSAAYETQLESWLGQGDMQFTNIFTKVAGDTNTSYTFHAAADGKGPTFVLLQVGTFIAGPGANNLYTLPTQIIGGYAPQSWNSSGRYNVTIAQSQRTAFIFNLTYELLERQSLTRQYGMYQTLGVNGYGPVFGTGDIDLGYIPLHIGLSISRTYGETVQTITVGGSDMNAGPGVDSYSIQRMEVYTFAAAPVQPTPSMAPVPEPSTYGIIGAGALACLGIYRRRKINTSRS